MDSVLASIVSLRPEGDQGLRALGTLCGKHIFTCAHMFNYLPVSLIETGLFDVCRTEGGPSGTFAMLLATTMDFMILAPDGLNLGLSEGGPTSSAFDVADTWEERHPHIKPTSVRFESGVSAVELPGFFFGPDGKTIHKTVFTIFRDSEQVSYFSNEMVPGCSGGPLFTEDLHLIGVNTNFSNMPNRSGQRHAVGRRIDLCCPQLLQPRFDWELLAV